MRFLGGKVDPTFRKKGVGTGARGVGREIMRWMDRWGGGVREAYMMARTRL